jgi:hypothetical protein
MKGLTKGGKLAAAADAELAPPAGPLPLADCCCDGGGGGNGNMGGGCGGNRLPKELFFVVKEEKQINVLAQLFDNYQIDTHLI